MRTKTSVGRVQKVTTKKLRPAPAKKRTSVKRSKPVVAGAKAVSSRYLGETEKNLRVVFKKSEKTQGGLLFDEADALFGKRTGVKDAHDRYANVETESARQRGSKNAVVKRKKSG